ncbi:MAG: PilZ domain-containing protein [Hyphomicrobium sp.]
MLRSKHSRDQREFGRRRVTVAAKVRLDDQTTLDCMVLNVSEGGALIEMGAPVELPQRFMLCIDGGMALACEARYRSGSRLGVEFTVARTEPTVDPIAVRDLVAFARQSPWGQDI